VRFYIFFDIVFYIKKDKNNKNLYSQLHSNMLYIGGLQSSDSRPRHFASYI